MVSGPLVLFLQKWMPYYAAVLVMAQVSFTYDTVNFYFYFDEQNIVLTNLIYSNIIYTLRVVASWFVIKKLWDWIGNFWIAVFFGAQLTFAVDYFIFERIMYT